MNKRFRSADFPDSFPDLESMNRFHADNLESMKSGVGHGGGYLLTDYQGNQAYYKRNILNGSFIKSEPETW
ncbi:hypothetical protein [Corynebacterium hesseae]|uniref:hypothetical protein n=1 Tax=Corynebacterium hesseae TaxID=2913502 RepID=UPI0022BA070B|nr:hypothetical protein [Corynebacterium hesseae]MCZ9297949.1 hypothetical protein [Corynebacterium hesseae]